MSRILLGAMAAIFLLGGAFALIQAQHQDEIDLAALPPPALEPVEDDIPDVNVGDMVGPKPPQATELTREQKRFARYDRNSDRLITRTELMSSRTKAFRKLDTDGNNLLTFEEWAVATSERFEKADQNKDGQLTPPEFATTKPKKAAKPACRC